jgi:nicotinamidase-related amidase
MTFSGLLPTTHPQGHLTNILRVMDAAAARAIPLVVVQHTFPQPDKPFFQRGTPPWELHPEVRGRPPRGCLHQRAEGVVYLSHNRDL